MRTYADTKTSYPLVETRHGVERDPHPADPRPPWSLPELREEIVWCEQQLLWWMTDGHLIARDEVIHQYQQRIDEAERKLRDLYGAA